MEIGRSSWLHFDRQTHRLSFWVLNQHVKFRTLTELVVPARFCSCFCFCFCFCFCLNVIGKPFAWATITVEPQLQHTRRRVLSALLPLGDNIASLAQTGLKHLFKVGSLFLSLRLDYTLERHALRYGALHPPCRDSNHLSWSTARASASSDLQSPRNHFWRSK
jgi:hypothetical protein